MQRVLSILNRYVPLMFFFMLVAAVFQLWAQFGPSPVTIKQAFATGSGYLEAHVWYLFASAVAFWGLFLLGIFHEAGRLPPSLLTRKRLMDILDRLTNKETLQQKLAEEVEPTFIDAKRLGRSLKQAIIGQDQVCEDLAAQIRRRSALKQRGKPVGVQQRRAGNFCALLGGNEVHLGGGKGALAALPGCHAQGVEGFGDDLGREAGDGQEDAAGVGHGRAAALSFQLRR